MREDLGHPSALRVRGSFGPVTMSEQGPFSRSLLSLGSTLVNFCQGASGLGLGSTCLMRQLGEGILGRPGMGSSSDASASHRTLSSLALTWPERLQEVAGHTAFIAGVGRRFWFLSPRLLLVRMASIDTSCLLLLPWKWFTGPENSGNNSKLVQGDLCKTGDWGQR